MNFVIEKYDSNLKQTFVQLGRSERLVETRNTSIARAKEYLNGAIKERDRAVIQKKPIKKKSADLEAELKVAREESEELRPKNAELEREKTEIASNHARELICPK